MNYPPNADRDDCALFDRARQIIPAASNWRDVSAEYLQTLSQQHGIELATAWWCSAIRSAAEHQELLRAVEGSSEPATSAPSTETPTILLIRGAFYGEHYHTGADGERFVKIATQIGWPVEVVQIESFGRLETNASIILDHLQQTRASRIVLVSLSKGSADIATAMKDPRAGAAMERVCGWVSLSGTITGTPLVKWLRSHLLRTIGVHLLLWSRGQRFAVVDQLRHGNGPLARTPVLPSHIRTIHVIGFPTRGHLRHPWASRGYERVAPLGPTDGGGILLSDLARWPGFVYPVWGADHYLQPDWDFEPLIRNILLHAARCDAQPNAIPTIKSTA